MSVAVNTVDGPGSSGFEDIYLLQDSVPNLALGEIDLRAEFLGKRLAYPLMINALTGGTEQSKSVNSFLAGLAHKYGLAMAVGSVTIALEEPSLRDSFSIVREMNPDGIILANLGANCSIEQACEAVNMIRADGLQLHFNVPQELAMSEGDRDFRGIIDNVSRIVEACPVPVIAKEVGFGFSRETVQKLYAAGIRIFDNGGRGGTNFLAIENQRDGKFAPQIDNWGIPTATSLAEIISLQLPIQTVASGGIRSAADIAKAMALGADLVGIAGLFLRIFLNEGPEALEKQMESLLYQLKCIFLMSGARDIEQMRSKPVIILARTAEWLRARNIEPGNWANR
jgi:isopentenyl-diphosphate Delta-isomerase